MAKNAAQREAARNIERIAGLLEACETKTERKALLRDYRANAKVLGIDIAAEQRKRTCAFKAAFKRKCKAEALNLPRETRQAALEMFKIGGTTFAEVMDALGLTREALMGIIDMNIVITRHKSLREVSL